MADEFKVFTPNDGDRIARAVRRSEQLLRNVQTGAEHQHFDSTEGYYIRNMADAAVPPGGLIGLGSSTYEEAVNDVVFEGYKPSTTYRDRYIANTDQDFEAGDVRWLPLLRKSRMAYDSGTPAKDEGWGPKPGQWTLSKGFPGAKVDVIVDSTNKLLLGTLSPITTLLCKATADLTKGPVSSNFQIWAGTVAAGSNSGYTVPTVEITEDIDSGDFFIAEFVNGGWVSNRSAGGPDGDTDEVTVITGWRYDATSHKIQLKTTVVKVHDPAAESGWTDAHSLTETDMATYLEFDSEHKLGWVRQQAWVMEIGEGTEAGFYFTLKRFIKTVYTASGNLLKQTVFSGYVVDPTIDSEETIDAGSDCEEV